MLNLGAYNKHCELGTYIVTYVVFLFVSVYDFFFFLCYDSCAFYVQYVSIVSAIQKHRLHLFLFIFILFLNYLFIII